MNETVTTGADVVVVVDLENFAAARGRIDLNLTANGTLVARQTVTVGVDARRTVSLRTTFERVGRYVLRVNGVDVGTVRVTTAETDAPTATREPASETTRGTPTPTPTEHLTPTEPSETPSPASSPASTGSPPVGPDPPTGTEAIVAVGLALLLLYGVGVAVYVLRSEPPNGRW